ncbi:MAG: hypothetical protein ACPGVN_06975 [Alphaproteobacteria bacterium]
MKNRIYITALWAVFLCLSTCGLAQPALAESYFSPPSQSAMSSFNTFLQAVATALFATCVAGIWRMNAQLTSMNARLTNAVTYIDQRLNDQHQRLLYQERKNT